MNDLPNELRWIQSSWKHRRYELTDGERTYAELVYRGLWKVHPHIVLDGEELALRGKGFWKASVAIMRGDQEIAVFKPGWRAGHLTFITGRTFTWRRKTIWSANYAFLAADNDEVVSLKSVARWARSESIVSIGANGRKYPELRILIAFGWYLMIASAQAANAAS